MNLLKKTIDKFSSSILYYCRYWGLMALRRHTRQMGIAIVQVIDYQGLDKKRCRNGWRWDSTPNSLTLHGMRRWQKWFL